MGIQDRKEKHRLQLRQAILAAALELAQSLGWKEVSIRKVAEKIEYAPSVVYQHFENKDELLRELREEGFGLLAQALQDLPVEEPGARLESIAQRFWDFAQTHRAYYTVMMELDGVTFLEKKPSPGSVVLTEFIAQIIQAWTESEGLEVNRLTMEWFEFILFVHGLVAASTLSFIADVESRLHFLLTLGVKDFLTAWKLRLRANK